MALTKIPNNLITADAIDGTLIANNAINSEHYTDGSIDTAHIAADQITSALIADDQIDSEHIVDGSIDLAHMSVNSIDSDQYVDGSIDLAHMSVNSIDSDQYVDGSIDNAHIADDAIGVAELSATGTASSSTFLRGDNSWTAVTPAAIATYGNASNNRVITSVDSDEVNAEANLTFDGSTLAVTGAATVSTTLGVTGATTLTSLTTSGNIGLGTPTDTWHSAYDVIQGQNFSLVNDASAGASKGVTLAYNAYIDSGNDWTYINADEASYIQQYNGLISFATAAAGSADATITFGTKMTILNDGKVGIGTTAPSGSLDITKVGGGDNPMYMDVYSTNQGHVNTLAFRHSKQNTVGNTHTITGTTIGRLEWYGNTGSAFTRAAYIGVVQGSSTETDGDMTLQAGGDINLTPGGILKENNIPIRSRAIAMAMVFG